MSEFLVKKMPRSERRDERTMQTVKSKVVKVLPKGKSSGEKSDRGRKRAKQRSPSPGAMRSKQRKDDLIQCPKGKNSLNPPSNSGGQQKQTTDFLAGDVWVDVEVPPNDEFLSDNEEEINNSDTEELDYDDVATQQELEILEEDRQSMVTDLGIIQFKDLTAQSKQRQLVNPCDLEDYVQKLVDSRWKEKEQELLCKHNIPVNEEPKGNSNNNKAVSNDRIKLPSDTTLYTPALNKTPQRNTEGFSGLEPGFNKQLNITPQLNIADKISNFVDQAHNQSEGRQASERVDRGHRPSEQPVTTQVKADYARDLAVQIIVGAKNFRAEVTKLQGKQIYENVLNNSFGNGQVDHRHFLGVEMDRQVVHDDDEFFHVTCHIDKTTTTKIERGEFMDLEKLIFRDCAHYEHEDRLELVSKDGYTYFAPAHDREPRINGV